MPRKTKKKLEEFTQTDGKQETFKPTTLSQIFGDNGLEKYKTLDVEEYIKQLKEMNLSDLRRHSLKFGIVPSMNRERIEKQLVTKFRQHINLYKKPSNTSIHPKDISNDKIRKALDVMSVVK